MCIGNVVLHSFKVKLCNNQNKNLSEPKMLLGFFLRTNKTFQLNVKNKVLPEYCSKGSDIYPHIIFKVDDVIPKLVYAEDVTSHIPLFTPVRISNHGALDMLDISNYNGMFCLIFYPDPDQPPALNPDNRYYSIIKEYWLAITPMIICRDVGGYYLGKVDDPNITWFTKCSEHDSDASLANILTGYNELAMQTESDFKFSNDRIYIKRVNRTSRI